jgi:hypothetical protein
MRSRICCEVSPTPVSWWRTRSSESHGTTLGQYTVPEGPSISPPFVRNIVFAWYETLTETLDSEPVDAS